VYFNQFGDNCKGVPAATLANIETAQQALNL